MPTLTVPPLTLRTVKGSPLTHGEHDENLTILSDFGNALADSISTSLNPDGTIKAGSVSTDSLAERVVSQKHLAQDWAPFAVDTGTSNAIRVAYTPAITSYDDKLVLFVKVASDNTGEVTVNVNGLGVKTLLKSGSLPLSAGDIQGGSVICVAYHGGSFHLVSASPSSSSGGSSSEVTVSFEQALALPGNGGSAEFLHGLDAAPENYSVYLLCLASELGYGVGAEVPIGSFTTVGLTPAFSVTASATSITVSQLAGDVYAPDLSNGGASTGITEGSWQLLVRVRSEVSNTQTMQPPLLIEVINPDGVISYGKDLFIIARNGGAIQRLNTKTGAVQFIQALSGSNYNNFGQFISGGVHRAFFLSDTGIFSFRLDTPGAISVSQVGSQAGLSHRKPQQISEDSADEGSTENPVIWSVGEYPSLSSSVPMYKHLSRPPSTTQTVGTINLYETLAGATNGQEFVKFEPNGSTYLGLFQWNPIKKRIYLMVGNGNNSAGFMHVFQISNAKLSDWWSLSLSARKVATTYIKTLALSVPGAPAHDAYRARKVVEFDLVTGQERAICISRPTTSGWYGTAIRVPWFEA